ncbi:cytochrome c biogenesis CcdA family protein [Actinotalea sp. K2]|uniref:cytochrome c biogenesis CcdA family protein n=1 Tax=Actinotalea sp. K2 TaxID=2939438 RepID=UPI002017DDDD|nr:cytochrome c biogenesis CcdA family protein [Actinotalea sp. K2]MCL3863056.1 cytochrome c biogenesis CcdA family protein [Actinotalea sp. K2]
MNAALLAGIGDTFQATVLDGSLLLAVPVAVIAGLVSFASPCVLPLVPGYLGYVTGMAGSAAARPVADRVVAGASAQAASGAPAHQPSPTTLGEVARGRMLAGVGLFVLGFTVVFVLFGVLAGSLGAVVNQWSDPITRVLGVVVILMGLVFTGWLPFAQRERRLRLAPSAGLWGAPLLGVVFGLGWAPCIGPTLVAVYTLALDGASAGRGALLSVAYCAGLGLPFLLIALGFERSTRALGFLRAHRVAIMRLGGVVLVVVGLALVSGLWGAWTQSLQGLIGGFEPVV